MSRQSSLARTPSAIFRSRLGTQLLYPVNDRLYAIRTDGTGLRVIAQAIRRIWAGCEWTPQGNRIVARTTGTSLYDNELVVLNADGSGTRQFYVRRSARVGNPVFSITGQQVLFAADSVDFQNEQGHQLDSRIYRFDLSRNTLTDLSVHNSSNSMGQSSKLAGTNDLEPCYDPTGANLIFTNTDNTGLNQRNVYIALSDGSNRKVLLQQAEMPYWR